jgi:hypothetical protein
VSAYPDESVFILPMAAATRRADSPDLADSQRITYGLRIGSRVPCLTACFVCIRGADDDAGTSGGPRHHD